MGAPLADDMRIAQAPRRKGKVRQMDDNPYAGYAKEAGLPALAALIEAHQGNLEDDIQENRLALFSEEERQKAFTCCDVMYTAAIVEKRATNMWMVRCDEVPMTSVFVSMDGVGAAEEQALAYCKSMDSRWTAHRVYLGEER